MNDGDSFLFVLLFIGLPFIGLCCIGCCIRYCRNKYPQEWNTGYSFQTAQLLCDANGNLIRPRMTVNTLEKLPQSIKNKISYNLRDMIVINNLHVQEIHDLNKKKNQVINTIAGNQVKCVIPVIPLLKSKNKENSLPKSNETIRQTSTSYPLNTTVTSVQIEPCRYQAVNVLSDPDSDGPPAYTSSLSIENESLPKIKGILVKKGKVAEKSSQKCLFGEEK